MAKITKSINGPLSIEVDNDKNSLTFRSLDGSLQANLGGAPTPYDIYNITEDSATVTRVVDKATNKLMFTATGAVPSDAHAWLNGRDLTMYSEEVGTSIAVNDPTANINLKFSPIATYSEAQPYIAGTIVKRSNGIYRILKDKPQTISWYAFADASSVEVLTLPTIVYENLISDTRYTIGATGDLSSFPDGLVELSLEKENGDDTTDLAKITGYLQINEGEYEFIINTFETTDTTLTIDSLDLKINIATPTEGYTNEAISYSNTEWSLISASFSFFTNENALLCYCIGDTISQDWSIEKPLTPIYSSINKIITNDTRVKITTTDGITTIDTTGIINGGITPDDIMANTADSDSITRKKDTESGLVIFSTTGSGFVKSVGGIEPTPATGDVEVNADVLFTTAEHKQTISDALLNKANIVHESVKLTEQAVDGVEWAFGHLVEFLSTPYSQFAPANTMVLHFNGDTDGTGDCIKCIMDDNNMYVKQFILQDVSHGTTTVLWDVANPTVYNSGSFYSTGGSYKLTSITGYGGLGGFFDCYGIKGSDYDLINAQEEIENNKTMLGILDERTNMLTKTGDGTSFLADDGSYKSISGEGLVDSVNGQVGEVVLDGGDITLDKDAEGSPTVTAAIQALQSSSITAVAHDDTLTGSGTADDPLSVTKPDIAYQKVNLTANNVKVMLDATQIANFTLTETPIVSVVDAENGKLWEIQETVFDFTTGNVQPLGDLPSLGLIGFTFSGTAAYTFSENFNSGFASFDILDADGEVVESYSTDLFYFTGGTYTTTYTQRTSLIPGAQIRINSFSFATQNNLTLTNLIPFLVSGGIK